MQIKFIVSTFEDFTDVQIRELNEAVSHWHGVGSVRVEQEAAQQSFALDAAAPWACGCDWVNNSDNVICVACGTPRR